MPSFRALKEEREGPGGEQPREGREGMGWGGEVNCFRGVRRVGVGRGGGEELVGGMKNSLRLRGYQLKLAWGGYRYRASLCMAVPRKDRGGRIQQGRMGRVVRRRDGGLCPETPRRSEVLGSTMGTERVTTGWPVRRSEHGPGPSQEGGA